MSYSSARWSAPPTPSPASPGSQSLTYSELNQRANQLAHFLQQRGIGPGQRIGLFVERSLAMMVGLLGIQKSGAAYVPLDPSYPAERLRLTLDDAQVPVLLTQQSLSSSMPEHPGRSRLPRFRLGEDCPRAPRTPPAAPLPQTWCT